MNDISLVEKLKILMNIIVSSPLFLFCSMVSVALLILYIILIKKNKKINKWIFIIVWCILLLMLIINYNTVVLNLLDDLFDNVIMALYFPSMTVYIIVLIISDFFFIYSLFSKKMDIKYRIVNFVNALLINLLLILIVDITKRNNIDIYNQLSIYSNSDLLVLFQFSTAIFTSWILINLFISAHTKLKQYDKKEKEELPEIVFEEI